MVGCNQIFEGMNHWLLGCTLQRNDPSATLSQLLHWCAQSGDPEEASLGQAGHLLCQAGANPLPQHAFQWMMISSFPRGCPAMAGWSACGARNSFVHPCPCLSLPGEQLLSVLGMVPVAREAVWGHRRLQLLFSLPGSMSCSSSI